MFGDDNDQPRMGMAEYVYHYFKTRHSPDNLRAAEVACAELIHNCDKRYPKDQRVVTFMRLSGVRKPYYSKVLVRNQHCLFLIPSQYSLLKSLTNRLVTFFGPPGSQSTVNTRGYSSSFT